MKEFQSCSSLCIYKKERKLPDLVHPSDYYPLAIIQAGRNEIAERSLRVIKKGLQGIGVVTRWSGCGGVFFNPFSGGEGY